MMAAVSIDRRKVIGVVFRSNSCSSCTQKDILQKGGKISRVEYLE